MTTKRKINLIRLDTVPSTNTYLKELAENGEDEGCVVIARSQTAGRGRRGKDFFSPADTGLYMSILLRPKLSVENAHFITPAAALAVCRAIEELTGTMCGIKWVNDIFVDGKKAAGILCEGAFDYEKNETRYIVAGIGVNLSTESFPEELENIATSLHGAVSKDALAEKIVSELFKVVDALPSLDFLDEYRRRSVLIGKRVQIIGDDGVVGIVRDIDSLCRLVVEKDEGGVVAVSSGEVSTKIVE